MEYKVSFAHWRQQVEELIRDKKEVCGRRNVVAIAQFAKVWAEAMETLMKNAPLVQIAEDARTAATWAVTRPVEGMGLTLAVDLLFLGWKHGDELRAWYRGSQK